MKRLFVILITCLVWSVGLFAQPTVGTATHGNFANVDGGSPATLAVTPAGTNRGLWIAISQYNGSGAFDIDNCTYNGSAATFVARKNNGTANSVQVDVYWVTAPATGSHNIVAYPSSGTSSLVIIVAVPIEGVDQTTPYDTAHVASADAVNTITNTDTNGATGDLEIDAVTAVVNADALTAAMGQTELGKEVDIGGGGVLAGASSTKAGGSSVGMTWTSNGSGTFWASVAASLNPVSAGGSGAKCPLLLMGVGNCS